MPYSCLRNTLPVMLRIPSSFQVSKVFEGLRHENCQVVEFHYDIDNVPLKKKQQLFFAKIKWRQDKKKIIKNFSYENVLMLRGHHHHRFRF